MSDRAELAKRDARIAEIRSNMHQGGGYLSGTLMKPELMASAGNDIQFLLEELNRRERNENRNCINWGPCSRHDGRMNYDQSTPAPQAPGEELTGVNEAAVEAASMRFEEINIAFVGTKGSDLRDRMRQCLIAAVPHICAALRRVSPPADLLAAAKDASDRFCVTLEDGSCISDDLRCAHYLHPETDILILTARAEEREVCAARLEKRADEMEQKEWGYTIEDCLNELRAQATAIRNAGGE